MTQPLVYGPFVSREIALERGYKRYYVNQPCRRGHVAPRSTKTRNCSRCDCDRKRKDPTAPLQPRSKTLIPEELRIRARLRQMKAPNFSYWARQGAYVYVYLSKKLKPYYVGVGSTRIRPIAGHSFQVPKDRRLIQIMKAGLTWDEAAEWERRYIAHYGRVDQETGCLWNMTDGGEGVPGRVVSEETKKRISKGHRGAAEKAAEKYGIPLDFYLTLDMPRRGALKNWLDRHPDENYQVYFDYEARSKIEDEANQRRGEARSRRTAIRVGVPVEVWLNWDRDDRCRYRAWLGSDPERNYEGYLKRHDGPHWAAGKKQSAELAAKRTKAMVERSVGEMASRYDISEQQWIDLTPDQRSVVRARFSRGKRGADVLLANLDQADVNPRVVKAAKRFEVSVEWWQYASVNQRNALRARFYRGVRGSEALTAGMHTARTGDDWSKNDKAAEIGTNDLGITYPKK